MTVRQLMSEISRRRPELRTKMVRKVRNVRATQRQLARAFCFHEAEGMDYDLKVFLTRVLWFVKRKESV